MPPIDESTLGLGVDNPGYLDLVTKQQEAIKAANQPYGMDAGQGAIAAGLGLLPALIGGLVRGREGLAIGAQAGLGGVTAYDNVLKNNYEKRSENEKANAALYGQQANSVLQNDLGFQKSLQLEGVKQDNRIDLRGIPQQRIISGGSNNPISAVVKDELARVTGKPAETFDGVTQKEADLLLKGKQLSQRDTELSIKDSTAKTTAAGEARRTKEQAMKTDERYLEGYDWTEGKRPDAEKFKVARAVNEGGRLLLNDIRSLRSSFAQYGDNALTGDGATQQQVILKRMLEHSRIYNKAGASFTDLEMELSRVVENAQNVGLLKAATNSWLFGKTPTRQLGAYENQLRGEIKSRMRSNGYVYNPPREAVLPSSMFEQLKGAASGQ